MKTDGSLSPLAAVTLDARIAMHEVIDQLREYAARSEDRCALCGHFRYFHGDPTYGCLDCPVQYVHWWSSRRKTHRFVEP